MTSGDSRGRFSEYAPTPLGQETHGLFENFADGGQSLMSAPGSAENCCGWPEFRLFPSDSSESFETDSSGGYGAYESFHLLTPNIGHCNRGYGDVRSGAWTDDMPIGWRMPYRGSSGRSRSPQSDCGGRNNYSSYNDHPAPFSSCTTSHTKPAPIGSCGRARSVYIEHLYGVRGGDTAAECRAKSRGFCGLSGASGIQNSRSNAAVPVFRGTKRKMTAPASPGKFGKKPKIVKAVPRKETGAALKFTQHSPESLGKDMSTEDAEDKKFRVREKRRRRREKNHEKYGDKHRLAFTCAFCKFRTFEDKDIEKHFGSTYHRETLDYIRRQAKFDDRVIGFLHDCMVHKFRKTVSALCKLRTVTDKKTNQEIMEGVTEDDYMRKVEVVHCMACGTYVPAFFTSVQQHLSSPIHLKSKVVYKEQLKRESVLTAKAIINNDSVKVRYEKYMKGEDPFVNDCKEELSSDSSEQDRPDEAEDDKVESGDLNE
ncbi:DBIRD complex subunit ZNF326 [Astyanax mexicanus]|uniref:DBIRD complex subunit ZNF326 n=1 Tax=Astyanax mexicanus TaxID=7994 RepID=UPI0020CB0750|nr:DBIRD complex subunit ZNF326 [Astyanax mexicanus]XP_022531155.2 DBIRD complex subunit ZNF326 [Astyanax mexicanus]XP_022531156.2 DBIRD complex subunit ZNF326 [Astyanax mexicanus]